jgi:hypothetical protein
MWNSLATQQWLDQQIKCLSNKRTAFSISININASNNFWNHVTFSQMGKHWPSVVLIFLALEPSMASMQAANVQVNLFAVVAIADFGGFFDVCQLKKHYLSNYKLANFAAAKVDEHFHRHFWMDKDLTHFQTMDAHRLESRIKQNSWRPLSIKMLWHQSRLSTPSMSMALIQVEAMTKSSRLSIRVIHSCQQCRHIQSLLFLVEWLRLCPVSLLIRVQTAIVVTRDSRMFFVHSRTWRSKKCEQSMLRRLVYQERRNSAAMLVNVRQIQLIKQLINQSFNPSINLVVDRKAIRLRFTWSIYYYLLLFSIPQRSRKSLAWSPRSHERTN